jgi:uncharacterized membrane protein YhfC
MQADSPVHLPIDPAAAAGLAIAGAICLAGPVLLAFLWRRRTGAPLSAFGAGALVFFIAQVVLRLPWQVPLARRVQAHPEWVFPFLIVSAFTAALFEETGRWAGYRYLLRERTRRTGVMLGLGHGGLEAILLVGFPLLGLLVAWVLASRGMIAPGPTLEAVHRQTSSLGFWSVQLAALERGSGMASHVGLSLIVLQVWMRGGLRWLFLAMMLHFAVNAVGVTLLHRLHVHALLAELVVAALATGVLLLGWRLTERVGRPPTAESSAVSGSP